MTERWSSGFDFWGADQRDRAMTYDDMMGGPPGFLHACIQQSVVSVLDSIRYHTARHWRDGINTLGGTCS